MLTSTTWDRDCPGYYFTEDMACYDKDGNCRILGREVDIIDCHGEHTIGRVEIESVLVC